MGASPILSLIHTVTIGKIKTLTVVITGMVKYQQ